MASSIVELDYALRARLGLVLAALVVFPGTWLVMVLGDSPGTLFHQRMRHLAHRPELRFARIEACDHET